MRLSEANETVDDTADRTCQNGIHSDALGYDVQLYGDLVLCKTHIDEDVADKDQHDSQYGERQRLRVVVEVAGDVHIVKSNERVIVLLLDRNMAQLADLHEKLRFLLVAQCLIDEDVVHRLAARKHLEVFSHQVLGARLDLLRL